MCGSIVTLERHLDILEKSRLMQESNSIYSLTEEGIRRLSELGVTKLEAIELTRERKKINTTG